jgi:hypothetical protein
MGRRVNNKAEVTRLVMKALDSDITTVEIFEILGTLAVGPDELFGEVVAGIVDAKIPINKTLEKGIYEILECKKSIEISNYARHVDLLNASAIESTNKAVTLSKQLSDSNPTNYDYLILHAISLLHNWRPLQAWPYLLQAVELEPTRIDAYNLILDIARRYPGTGLVRKAIQLAESTRTRELQVDINRQNNFKNLQQDAIARGMPSVLINTQMKSGTIYLQGLFSSLLSAPHCQVALTGIANIIIVNSYDFHYGAWPLRNWLSDFGLGGAVCVDHFDISADRIKYFRDANIRKIVIHTRDIRRAALSALYFSRNQEKYSGVLGTFAGDIYGDFKPLDVRFEKHCIGFINTWQTWLRSWVEISDKNELNVLFTKYEDFVADEEKFVRRILDFYHIEISSLQYTVDEMHQKHFRSGDPEEYNRVISKDVRTRVWKMLDPELCERFGWTE